uniref:Uncharacterized protein n=1 Tax=Panagrellus redivivus TaxID=6233 RepID=A0A7E4VAV8_PANRE
MTGHRGKVSKPPATKKPAHFPPPTITKKPVQPQVTPKRGPMDLSSSMSSIDIDDPAAVVISARASSLSPRVPSTPL